MTKLAWISYGWLKFRPQHLGTLLDTGLCTACHLLFPVHLIYAWRSVLLIPISCTRTQPFTHEWTPTSRSPVAVRRACVRLFWVFLLHIYNTYALFRNTNIVYTFLSSVGPQFSFSLTLALSTGKKTIGLLNKTRYCWVTALTKTNNLITRTTGRSVQLLWPAN